MAPPDLNGPGGVMCASLRRGEPIATTDASSYTADLKLDRPRRIEITAHGPLGIPGSANTVSATQWVYPGKDILEGDGFLLEVPGLIVQIVSPSASSTAASVAELSILAHIAMMCGCPIDYKTESSQLALPSCRPINNHGCRMSSKWQPLSVEQTVLRQPSQCSL